MTTPNRPQLWLRSETRAGEARSPLTPGDAGRLVDAGLRVVVERSQQRCFDDSDYLALGCQLALPGQWCEAAPDSFVLGLKELPADVPALHHRHIYFGHAFKGQPGARALLARFSRGGGELLDLEYLVDDAGRRLAAFGYWAGFAGAALGVLAWARRARGLRPTLPPQWPRGTRAELLKEIESELRPALALAAPPNCLVMGAAGRCGSGARALLESLRLPCTGWDIEETRGGGPFAALLEQDILINCVLLQAALPPFLTPDLLQRPGCTLGLIVDVSCDPGNPHNPLPLYTRSTSLDAPLTRLAPPAPALDLIAVDNLPSLLPAESSTDFSAQLLPALLQLPQDAAPWQRARALFHHHFPTR